MGRPASRSSTCSPARAWSSSPVIVALTEWGDRWVRPGPVEFRSGLDGQPVGLQLRGTDEARLDVADVVAKRR